MVGRRQGRRLVAAWGVVLAGSIALAVSVGGVGTPAAVAAPDTAPPNAATRAAPIAADGSKAAAPARAAAPAVAATRTAAAAPASPLRPGSSGQAVRALQDSLLRLGYFVPAATGYYGHGTSQAVMALQKAAGSTRSGVYDAPTAAALRRGVAPKARTRGKGRLVEIDLARQLLLLVQDGRVLAAVNTSTGKLPEHPTPRGRFRVFRQVDAWDKAPLGELYRPKYFHRGYAIHGVRDGGIPGAPASHGCARVGMAAMDRLWGPGGVRVGDPVWVY